MVASVLARPIIAVGPLIAGAMISLLAGPWFSIRAIVAAVWIPPLRSIHVTATASGPTTIRIPGALRSTLTRFPGPIATRRAGARLLVPRARTVAATRLRTRSPGPSRT
jgi:hypothetical protein